MRKSAREIEAFLATSIADVAAGKSGGRRVTADLDILTDLGLDSLEYATVLLSCERWLGTRIQEQGIDWSALSTVGNLAAFLERQQS
jgi:acyl carrier protein